MELIDQGNLKVLASAALVEALHTAAPTPVLLMLSGGSALSLLEAIPSDVFDAKLTITMLDERYSIDPAISNFAQLEATDFYSRAVAAGAATISTKVLNDETVDALRRRIECSLYEWRANYRDGIIIATMGVGEDGHTAGIFAGDHGVDFESDCWILSYDLPALVSPYSPRITVSNTFLRHYVNTAIVYAIGENKYRHLKQVQSEAVPVRDIPAAILQEMKEVKIFTSRM